MIKLELYDQTTRMTNSQRLAHVRSALLQYLASNADFRQPDPTQPPFRESILIRKGFYCGRRLDAGSHHAVWFMEEDQLKVYDESHVLLATLGAAEIDSLAAAFEATMSQSAPDAAPESSETPTLLSLPKPLEDTPAPLRRAA